MSDVNWRPEQDRGWDLIGELQALRSRLGRLVGAFGATPDMEIARSDGGWIVTVRLPGVAPEEVAVELDGRDLCIRSRTEAEVNADYGEPGTGSQTRSFEYRLSLPAGADADRIDAVMDHGLLTVAMPRSGQAMRREIVVGRPQVRAGGEGGMRASGERRTGAAGAPADYDPAADREMHHPDAARTDGARQLPG